MVADGERGFKPGRVRIGALAHLAMRRKEEIG
jgi:hypothetical protein